MTASTLAGGGTIDWVSGSTTTIGAPTLTSTSAKKCPGYVKNAASEPSADTLTAAVTADTGDSILIPGTVTGEICIGTNLDITALKAAKFSWTDSDVACTTINGTAAEITVSGCTGGDTGGGSEPFSGATLAAGGTIDWLSGGSITISAPTLTTTPSDKKCPGYVKNAASEPTGESFTAVVSSDTGDGLKFPASAKGAVCISTSGAITALKPLTAK